MTHRNLAVALLGFAMTIMSPSQSSGMYDPGLGRFCSRDPIGYVDGKNLFENYFGISMLDPSGLAMGDFALGFETHKGSPSSLTKCGKAQWNINFLVARKKGKGGFQGLIVQRAGMSSDVKKCECGKEIEIRKDSDEYRKKYPHEMPFYELFEFDNSGNDPNRKPQSAPQDLITTPDWGVDTKGTTTVTLTAWFFAGVQKPPGFNPAPPGHPGGSGEPVSGSDPYPNSEGDAKPLSRMFTVKWDCCDTPHKQTLDRVPAQDVKP